MKAPVASMIQPSAESPLRLGGMRWFAGFLRGPPERHVATLFFAIGAALALPLMVEQLFARFTVKTATVVSGEQVEVGCTIWSPWSEVMTLAQVSGGCTCTSATISPLTIKPWTRFAVKIVYDSSGKPLGWHSMVVRAVDSEGTVHELPVRFDIQVVPPNG